MAIVRRSARGTRSPSRTSTCSPAIVESDAVWWRRVIPIIAARARALDGRGRACAAAGSPDAPTERDDHPARRRLRLDAAPPTSSPTRIDAAVDCDARSSSTSCRRATRSGLVAFSSTPRCSTRPRPITPRSTAGSTSSSPEAGRRSATASSAADQAGGLESRRGRRPPHAGHVPAGGDRARIRRRPEPRHAHSRRSAAKLAKADGVRIYGVALGTRHGKVTYGYGLYQQSIPVPPDPAAVDLLAKTTGGQAFNAHERAGARHRLPHSRLEHRPPQRDPGDHVLVRDRRGSSCSSPASASPAPGARRSLSRKSRFSASRRRAPTKCSPDDPPPRTTTRT